MRKGQRNGDPGRMEAQKQDARRERTHGLRGSSEQENKEALRRGDYETGCVKRTLKRFFIQDAIGLGYEKG